jgi:hypothetical protein
MVVVARRYTCDVARDEGAQPYANHISHLLALRLRVQFVHRRARVT